MRWLLLTCSAGSPAARVSTSARCRLTPRAGASYHSAPARPDCKSWSAVFSIRQQRVPSLSSLLYNCWVGSPSRILWIASPWQPDHHCTPFCVREHLLGSTRESNPHSLLVLSPPSEQCVFSASLLWLFIFFSFCTWQFLYKGRKVPVLMTLADFYEPNPQLGHLLRRPSGLFVSKEVPDGKFTSINVA